VKTPLIGIVTKAYERLYPDPITLSANDQVVITKQDMWEDQYLWLWCTNNGGKEGWVPANFLEVQGNRGVATCDYNAWELTVNEGEKVTILKQESGWYWAANQNGEQGWVPVSNITIEQD
jgi:hypothetical protein